MSDRATLEREAQELTRTITTFETQVKSLREYIASQERNLRGAAESVRNITERSLADARGDLYVKELRLQQLCQERDGLQTHLTRLATIERKRQDIATFERERDRLLDLMSAAQRDLQMLLAEHERLSSPTQPASAALVFANGDRFPVDGTRDVLIGCADATHVPDVDLTALGGTSRGVSRRHALLRRTNGAWMITDLQSTNGTYVHAARIPPHMPTPVADQTRLRFGSLDAVLTVEAQPVTATVRL